MEHESSGAATPPSDASTTPSETCEQRGGLCLPQYDTPGGPPSREPSKESRCPGSQVCWLVVDSPASAMCTTDQDCNEDPATSSVLHSCFTACASIDGTTTKMRPNLQDARRSRLLRRDHHARRAALRKRLANLRGPQAIAALERLQLKPWTLLLPAKAWVVCAACASAPDAGPKTEASYNYQTEYFRPRPKDGCLVSNPITLQDVDAAYRAAFVAE